MPWLLNTRGASATSSASFSTNTLRAESGNIISATTYIASASTLSGGAASFATLLVSDPGGTEKMRVGGHFRFQTTAQIIGRIISTGGTAILLLDGQSNSQALYYTNGAASWSFDNFGQNDFRMLRLVTGNIVWAVDGADNVGFFNVPSAGGGDNVTFIGNRVTAPTSNPTGGGILYCESGALKYRGTSGSVTTIAPP